MHLYVARYEGIYRRKYGKQTMDTQSGPLPPLLSILSSPAIPAATAGCIAKIIVYPADVVKINIQISESSEPSLKVTTVAKYVYKSRGIPGFYKGLPLGCLRNIAIQGSRFAFFDRLRDDYGLFQASVISGALQTFVTYPLEMWRTRRIVIRKAAPSSHISAFSRALSISLLYTVSDFGVYARAKDIGLPPQIAGAMSTLIAQSIIYPIDTQMRYKIMGLQYIRWTMLYRGFLFNAVRVMPNGSLYYTLYEHFRGMQKSLYI